MRPFPKGRTFRDPFAVGSALEHVLAESRGTSRDTIEDICGYAARLNVSPGAPCSAHAHRRCALYARTEDHWISPTPARIETSAIYPETGIVSPTSATPIRRATTGGT